MRGATHFVQTISSHGLSTAPHPDKIFRQIPPKSQLNPLPAADCFFKFIDRFLRIARRKCPESNGHTHRTARLADTPLWIAFPPRHEDFRLFISASNEPSGHACMSIWRLPRGLNTLMCASGYLTQGLHVWKVLENKMFEEPFGADEDAVRVTSEGD